jgi:branched-chain amino acid transport system ATP-binding protein
VIKVEGIRVVYGASVLALDDVSLEVGSGEFVTVLGPNGAGKTTLVRALTGLLGLAGGSVTRGAVTVHGRAVKRTRTSSLVKSGLGIVPERRMLFPEMSVRENLLCGASSRRETRRARLDEIFSLFPEIARRPRTPAGLLSGGEQQMVAVGRALMSGPLTLICDEISLGLAPVVVSRLFETLKEMNGSGMTILLIEQAAAAALRVAERYYVLEMGNIVEAGRTSDADLVGRVGRAYLGASPGDGR